MALSLLFVALMLPATPATPTGIAVLPAQLDASAKDLPREVLDENILTAVQEATAVRVVGQDDMDALVGFEKQKELLGCDDATCFAEIGGALGVERVIVVKVARVGDEWAWTAKLLDLKAAAVERRMSRLIGGSAKDLLQALPALVRDLMGPSRALVEQAQAAGGDLSSAAAAPLPKMSAFTAAHLSADDYWDLKNSDLTYENWAHERNEESWTLEISKWVFTGLAVFAIGGAINELSTRRACTNGCLSAQLLLDLPALGLWVLDLANVGSVPPTLPAASGAD